MNLVIELLNLEDILINLQATSKKRVFEQIGLLFENNRGIARSAVFDSLFEREKLGSTGLGKGVAIPHGRVENIKAPVGAFIRLNEGVPFDAPDGKPVKLLFVLLVPEQCNDGHLGVLSELANMLHSDEMINELLKAANSEEIYYSLINYDVNLAKRSKASV